jgi:hypothetical protein
LNLVVVAISFKGHRHDVVSISCTLIKRINDIDVPDREVAIKVGVIYLERLL